MGKNMNFIPSLFLLSKQKQIWLWPSSSCSTNNPKTLSFRATNNDHHDHKNNKDNLLVEPELVELTTTHATSCFTNSSSESASVSTESEGSAVENIVRGARSDRLFFEPDATSSILETQGASGRKCSRLLEINNNGADHGLPYKESVAMVIESENPYFDFKKSMEEMVKIHELKDWNSLEELLGWFLRMNGKIHHEFIVGAFVDLLAGIYDGGGGCDGGSTGGACLDDHRSTGSFTSVGSTFSSPISSPTSQGKMVTK